MIKKHRVKRMLALLFLPFLIFALLSPLEAAAKVPHGNDQAKGKNNESHQSNSGDKNQNQKGSSNQPNGSNQGKNKNHGHSGKQNGNQGNPDHAVKKEKSNKQGGNSSHKNKGHNGHSKHQNNKNETGNKEKGKPANHPKKTTKKTKKPSQHPSNKNKPEKMHPTPHPKNKTKPKQPNSNKSTQIHLHLNKCYKSTVSAVYVQWNGKWIQMSSQGNSPLYKLKDGGDYVKDDISAFKLMTKANKKIMIPVSEMRVGIEAQGTINYWLVKCEQNTEPGTGTTNPPPGGDKPPGDDKPTGGDKPPGDDKPTGGDKPTGDDKPAGGDKPTGVDKPAGGDKPPGDDHPSGNDQPGSDKNGAPQGTHTSEKTTQKPAEPVRYSGILPKTGESSPIGYFLTGLLIAALGVWLFISKKSKKMNQ